MKIKCMLISLIISLIWDIVTSISNSEFHLSQINLRYSLQLQVGSQKVPLDLIIDTGLSTSLINSIDCILCQMSNTKNYDPTKSKTNEKMEEAMYKRRKYQYKGTEFRDTFFITDNKKQQLSGTNTFLSIVNISLTNSISESGFISISYFSDFFKMMNQKKIISLKLTDSNGIIKIGDIDPDEINTTELIYYPITIDDNEHTWFLQSNELIIKSQSTQAQIFNDKEQKLMFDTTTYQFHIPRDFFYANLQMIIPVPCQIQLNGLFYCKCLEMSPNIFPTYDFIVGNEKISITPEHYLSFDLSNHNCILHININYYTEYWIIGLSLLKNNHTLIDFDSSPPRMAFVTQQVPQKNQATTFIIVFATVSIISCLLFVGGYFLYNKYYLRVSNNEGNIPINQN